MLDYKRKLWDSSAYPPSGLGMIFISYINCSYDVCANRVGYLVTNGYQEALTYKEVMNF